MIKINLWFLSLVLLISEQSRADNWRVLEPKEVYFDLYQNLEHRDLYSQAIDKSLGKGVGFTANLILIQFKNKGLYLDNSFRVDENIKTSTFALAHQKQELGLNFLTRKNQSPLIDLYYSNETSHLLDQTKSFLPPIRKVVGVRLFIFETPRSRLEENKNQKE